MATQSNSNMNSLPPYYPDAPNQLPIYQLTPPNYPEDTIPPSNLPPNFQNNYFYPFQAVPAVQQTTTPSTNFAILTCIFQPQKCIPGALVATQSQNSEAPPIASLSVSGFLSVLPFLG
ncbi:unnamed protein product [Allacma fusca]|uniref:Uncharacterized protein n=1 Tax=Allacma fusca TaxID=39272 RepID=A0A8J2Q630_9HEXA|nr:unnamed protein product [Allacma fusca]